MRTIWVMITVLIIIVLLTVAMLFISGGEESVKIALGQIVEMLNNIISGV